MKNKNYKQKRKDLKNFKKVAEERGFEDSRHRKSFKEDIRRSFRSLKRSEKQIIEKQIEEEICDHPLHSRMKGGQCGLCGEFIQYEAS